MCLAFIGYEGSAGHVAAQRRHVGRIVRRHGGLCIGSGPGALYDQKKFDPGAAEGSLGVPGYITRHLSRSYHSGAWLYFSFGLKPSGRGDPPDPGEPI